MDELYPVPVRCYELLLSRCFVLATRKVTKNILSLPPSLKYIQLCLLQIPHLRTMLRLGHSRAPLAITSMRDFTSMQGLVLLSFFLCSCSLFLSTSPFFSLVNTMKFCRCIHIACFLSPKALDDYFISELVSH